MRDRELDYFFEPEELGLEVPVQPEPERPVQKMLPDSSSPPKAIEPRLEHSQATQLFTGPTPAIYHSIAGRRRIGVHALGQYVYCPRSAVLALESGDEREVDEPEPRLDYLPNYDLQRIDEALSETLRVFWGVFLVAGIAGIGVLRGMLDLSRVWLYPSLAVFVLAAACLLKVVEAVWRLGLRRVAAMRANEAPLLRDVTTTTPVNWWTLRKSGFQVASYDEPFRHPELPLEGQPWRVLEHGSLRIPVVRSGRVKLGETPGEVYEKHQVRLAAYAALLEAIPGVRSPYGVVLRANSTKGLAVPITKGSYRTMLGFLEEFVTVLEASEEAAVQPRQPANKNRCLTCRHGLPEPISRQEIDRQRDEAASLLVLRDPRDNLYQCDCGNRFGAAPPHKVTLAKKLVAVVE